MHPRQEPSNVVPGITVIIRLTSLGGAVQITNEEHRITSLLTQVVRRVDNALFVQRPDVLARRIELAGCPARRYAL